MLLLLQWMLLLLQMQVAVVREVGCPILIIQATWVLQVVATWLLLQVTLQVAMPMVVTQAVECLPLIIQATWLLQVAVVPEVGCPILIIQATWLLQVAVLLLQVLVRVIPILMQISWPVLTLRKWVS
jgi:hypothetical protein